MNLWDLIMIKMRAAFKAHKADPGAHHAKYTDIEAVTAVDASNKFVESGIVNVVTDTTELKKQSPGIILNGHCELAASTIVSSLFQGVVESTTTTYNDAMIIENIFVVDLNGTDEHSECLIRLMKLPSQKATYWNFTVVDTAKLNVSAFSINHNNIEVHNLPIKNIKNDVDATLSGTPKIIELDINGTPYYIKAYPTKT